jgi:hypothetical protein
MSDRSKTERRHDPFTRYFSVGTFLCNKDGPLSFTLVSRMISVTKFIWASNRSDDPHNGSRR